MANQPHDPNQVPLLPNGVRPRMTQRIATLIGQHVVSLVRIVFWGVLAAAALAVAYIAIRGIWWALQLVTRALGV